MWQNLGKKSFAEAVFTQRATFNSRVYILAPGVEYICNDLFAFKFHRSSDIYMQYTGMMLTLTRRVQCKEAKSRHLFIQSLFHESKAEGCGIHFELSQVHKPTIDSAGK